MPALIADFVRRERKGGDDGGDEDTLGVKLTVEKDLALDDIAGDV